MNRKPKAAWILKPKEINLTMMLSMMLLLAAMLLAPIVSVIAQTDDVLDAETSDALLVKSGQIVQGLTRGENTTRAAADVLGIIEKLRESQDLVGATKQEAFQILTEEVTAVVRDKAYTDELLAKLRPLFGVTAETSETSETPETRAAPTSTAAESGEPAAPEKTSEPIKEGESRLTVSTKPAPSTELKREYTCPQGYTYVGPKKDATTLSTMASTFPPSCYKNCGPGERSDGNESCLKKCPDNLPDNGLYCEKRGEYGRGAGYAIWNEKKCNAENSQGCEKSGALWYPKCKSGYVAFGCCLCKPACPQGWEDIGVSCKRPAYQRFRIDAALDGVKPE